MPDPTPPDPASPPDPVSSPPPDPRQTLASLAREFLRTHDRRLLMEYLRNRGNRQSA